MTAIATQNLARAELSTASKNAILRKLTRQVALYNALDRIRSLPAQRFHALDDIMKTASAYVTSKPPQPKPKTGSFGRLWKIFSTSAAASPAALAEP
ncbi:MAG: hypothetical protein AAGA32_20750 [Pseudomonadota bacterium]